MKYDIKFKNKLFKDKPLYRLVLSEFEKPSGDYFSNLRRFCISLGLVNPGESRIGIVYILDILLKARKDKPNGLSSYDIIKKLYSNNVKIVYANILRDLRKLIATGIVEKIDSNYRIKENMDLPEILDKFVKPYIIDRVLKKVGDYASAIEKDVKKRN
ncbi:hypothetical protein IHI26_00230 [Candidatus Parvarchaeota archaeon]|jgi:hypothetical protein|nr:hypothetical protein [Candidatus Acidifodinimicrobium mancum]MBE5729755.1 hypothetical protein [Candidatus Acidifodinimicrobium mancum]